MNLFIDLGWLAIGIGAAWFLYWFGKAIYLVFGGFPIEIDKLELQRKELTSPLKRKPKQSDKKNGEVKK